MKIKQMRHAGSFLWLAFFLITGCASSPENEAGENTTEKTNVQEEKKESVAPNTVVATFQSNMDDAVTNNDFEVHLISTDDAEKMKVTISYGENEAEDVIDFPKPQYYKKAVLREGDNSDVCIIGFVDNNDEFRELDQVIGSTTSIQIKHLKSYYFK